MRTWPQLCELGMRYAKTNAPLDDPQNCGILAAQNHRGDSRSMLGSFDEIDDRRQRHGLTRKALYERAGLHKETWRRTATGRTEPNLRTLRRLSEALDALVNEREGAR
jgi:ribosome-binding protein aMBF1 (putative translation factor)